MTKTTQTAQTAQTQIDLDTLLTGGAPETLTKQIIDFTKTPLPEFAPRYAAILDNVFTAQECTDLIRAAETKDSWERAMVNVGGGRQRMITDVRNCGRIIWDDKDLVARIWARCEPHLQEIVKLENMPHVTGSGPATRKEVWTMTRLNERMRFLKYVGGEYFKTHCDGVYETPDRKERSYYKPTHLVADQPSYRSALQNHHSINYLVFYV